MRFICTILSVIGILLIIAQAFAREPFTVIFILMDFAVVGILIYTASLWYPTCKTESKTYVEIVPQESI